MLLTTQTVNKIEFLFIFRRGELVWSLKFTLRNLILANTTGFYLVIKSNSAVRHANIFHVRGEGGHGVGEGGHGVGDSLLLTGFKGPAGHPAVLYPLGVGILGARGLRRVLRVGDAEAHFGKLI